jgi:hypothetical protein
MPLSLPAAGRPPKFETCPRRGAKFSLVDNTALNPRQGVKYFVFQVRVLAGLTTMRKNYPKNGS